MEILIIISCVLFALWGGSIAKKQGRNVGIAVVFSILFGILTIICYAIAGDTEETKNKRILEFTRKFKEQNDDINATAK